LKKPAKEKSESQLERFKEAARNLEADDSDAGFDRVLRKVASAPPAAMPKT
jgi:hypothetical protein